MLRLTLKSLSANRMRFALTTFGVILAVSFVVSALVLGDGLRRSFTDVSTDITTGVDLQVRPAAGFGDPEPLPSDLAGRIAGIDGVAAAEPGIEAGESVFRPIPPDGEPITIYGPPQLGYNWVDDPDLSPFRLVDGTAPSPGEFVIDIDSAASHGFAVGDAYDVLTPVGRRRLELSGTFAFGPDNATLGSVLTAVNTRQAGALFGIDGVTSVEVRVTPGAEIAPVQASIAAAFPDLEVVDNDAVQAETAAEFTEGVDILRNILLGFGGVALFVSVFIIYNTFAIVVGQRTRELALLRALGASPRQIRGAIVGEALVIGAIASIAGLGGGVATAMGIDAVVAATGVELPDHPLVVSARTVVVALLIGFGATLFAALGPARRASVIAPVAALNHTNQGTGTGGRKRLLFGSGLAGAGLAVGLFGLWGVGSTAVTIAAMATGAAAVFLGVTVLSPMAVAPVVGVFGWPMQRAAGVAGAMAGRNAARNPRRTATAAAALMVGLALVTAVLVIGESIKRHVGATIDDVAIAEYVVTDELDELDFPVGLLDDVTDDPAVETAAGFTALEAAVDGRVVDITTTDFASVGSLLDLDMLTGGFADTVPHPVVIQIDEARSRGVGVGDTMATMFANGARVTSTVTGVFAASSGVTADYVFDASVARSAGLRERHDWLAISLVDGADPAAVDSLSGTIAADFPDARFETAQEYVDRMQGSIDNLLAIVNVMVALAVVIALIGIANTLALSVFERTRELGLVRAVGMTRRQLRRMVRIEASLVAAFGAALGVAVGVVFGLGAVAALPDTITGAVAIPVVPIMWVIAAATVAGVAAAALPARRAGRLDVLDAIADSSTG